MSSMRTSTVRRTGFDHFEPEVSDPQDQRRLRGQLEQIDYTAFAANTQVLGQVVGHADAQAFQRIAVAAAMARAQWIKEALAVADGATAPTPERLRRLGELRAGFEELAEAYEGLRRMVERGYVPYRGGQG